LFVIKPTTRNNRHTYPGGRDEGERFFAFLIPVRTSRERIRAAVRTIDKSCYCPRHRRPSQKQRAVLLRIPTAGEGDLGRILRTENIRDTSHTYVRYRRRYCFRINVPSTNFSTESIRFSQFSFGGTNERPGHCREGGLFDCSSTFARVPPLSPVRLISFVIPPGPAVPRVHCKVYRFRYIRSGMSEGECCKLENQGARETWTIIGVT